MRSERHSLESAIASMESRRATPSPNGLQHGGRYANKEAERISR